MFADPVNLVDPFGLDAVTRDPYMKECFCKLYEKGGYGSQEGEAGMTIVPTGGKDYPYVCTNFTYQPTIRKGTVKVSPGSGNMAGHTHPKSAQPEPSHGKSCKSPSDWDDACTANYSQGDVYVASQKGVWKITPTGDITQEEGEDYWKTGHENHDKKTCGCR